MTNDPGGIDVMESTTGYLDLDMEYYEAQSHRFTFQADTVRKRVERELEGTVLNLFAGKTPLRHGGERL